MYSPTHGELSFDEVYLLIRKYIFQDEKADYQIAVGTDSQSYGYTKVSLAVGVRKLMDRVGVGNIYFYEIRKLKTIYCLKQKIFYEANQSLNLATKLRRKFKEDHIRQDIFIHVDAGYNGPSSLFITEIMTMIQRYGFNCKFKPDSYMASSVANRFSK